MVKGKLSLIKRRRMHLYQEISTIAIARNCTEWHSIVEMKGKFEFKFNENDFLCYVEIY